MRYLIQLSALTSFLILTACSKEPVATGYKSKLAQPATNPNPGEATPPAVAGNATSGAATLAATCETAGCHAVTGVADPLVKADAAKIDTTAPDLSAHRKVKALFTSDGANIKAALSARP